MSDTVTKGAEGESIRQKVADAGVFNLNLNNARSNSNSNIGFRSALPSYCQISRMSTDVLSVHEG